MKNMRLWLISVLLLCSVVASSQAINPTFNLKFKDEVTPYAYASMFLMPGETVEVEAVMDTEMSEYTAYVEKGDLKSISAETWEYTAPTKQGAVDVLVVKNKHAMDSIIVNCFVMVPYSELENGYLNGYHIGQYPTSTKPIYSKPEGFVEIIQKNRNLMLSPHFVLQDFQCKQAGGYPKYVVIRQRQLLKLEMVIEQLNLAGYQCSGLKVMSGYRTPQYNKAIGNVQFSRHVFGDSCDVYIDEDGDGQMDDLNGDGKSNKQDARVLFNLVNGLQKESWYKPFIGGLGLYGRNSSHPAFVHIDSRGYVARWGN